MIAKQHLKDFLANSKYLNLNVAYSLIDQVIAEVAADVDDFLVVNTPTATLPDDEGDIDYEKEVEFECETAGAEIYYTVDGKTAPTDASILYTGPITLTEDITFKVIAYKGYQKPSSVATFTYTVAAAPEENGDGDGDDG